MYCKTTFYILREKYHVKLFLFVILLKIIHYICEIILIATKTN